MKRRIRELLVALCVMLTFLVIAPVSMVMAAGLELSEEEIAGYKESATTTIESLVSFSDEEIEAAKVQYTDEALINAVTSWQSAKEELGEYSEILNQEVKTDASSIVITTNAQFANKKGTITLSLAVGNGGVSLNSLNFEVDYSLGEKMVQAGLNTLMGVAVVFLMLIFLSVLIAQFKHISKLENKLTGKKETKVEPAKEEPVMVPVSSTEVSAELVDDMELVAVISAAIAAYENTSTDGFRVRSIKRANTKNWKSA